MKGFHRMERVACYFDSNRKTGFIRGVTYKKPTGNILQVMLDGETQPMDIHEKQCRKLIKKKRREFWILKDKKTGMMSAYNYVPSWNNDVEMIKAREVKE